MTELNLAAIAVPGQEKMRDRIAEHRRQMAALAAGDDTAATIETQEVVLREVPREPETLAEWQAQTAIQRRLDAMFEKRRTDPDEFRSAQYLFKAEAALELILDEYDEAVG